MCIEYPLEGGDVLLDMFNTHSLTAGQWRTQDFSREDVITSELWW